jgi:hypothetical protein
MVRILSRAGPSASRRREKRRGKGEGTIYQRPDKSWCAIVDHGVVDGKRRRTSLYGKTRKEVVEKLKALRLKEQQGIAIDRPKQPVAQFLSLWLEQVVAVRNKPRTRRSYLEPRNLVRHFKAAL